MLQNTRRGSSVTPTARKLSDIIVEIARIGFKAPFRDLDQSPNSVHILMLLASQAWNREVCAGQPHPSFRSFTRTVETMVRELAVSEAVFEHQLISTDWETV